MWGTEPSPEGAVTSLAQPAAAAQRPATATTRSNVRFNLEITTLPSFPAVPPRPATDQYFATTGPPNLWSRPTVTTENVLSTV